MYNVDYCSQQCIKERNEKGLLINKRYRLLYQKDSIMIYLIRTKNLFRFFLFHLFLIKFIMCSQFDYDQGFMYDVSLQIESEFNGDVKSIVPTEHKRHRSK